MSDDSDLQNEPLELKVLDYDAITADDAVGSVFIDLNPLLCWGSLGLISGWIPIYDSLRGVRGEINVQVKLQFFGDVNPFKDSSAGVQFYAVNTVPASFDAVEMHGFVDAQITEDDPEYHWSDSFRTPRSSNEARQRLLFRAAGQVRRLLGRKVLELGGNAVIGYRVCFDLEEYRRVITVRAYGAAVKANMADPATGPFDPGLILNLASPVSPPPMSSSSPQHQAVTTVTGHDIAPGLVGPLAKSVGTSLADIPATYPGNSFATAASSFASARAAAGPFQADMTSIHSLATSAETCDLVSAKIARAKVQTASYKYIDQQLLTLERFPPGLITSIGGIVSARSVKLLDSVDNSLKDSWWAELRDEIKSHARLLQAPHVVGYSEEFTVNNELCVLSAMGTAVNVDWECYENLRATVPASRDEFSGAAAATARDLPDSATRSGMRASSVGPDPATTTPRKMNRRRRGEFHVGGWVVLRRKDFIMSPLLFRLSPLPYTIQPTKGAISHGRDEVPGVPEAQCAGNSAHNY